MMLDYIDIIWACVDGIEDGFWVHLFLDGGIT